MRKKKTCTISDLIPAIASALNSISKDTWNKVQEQNMATKDIVFSACVIHGLLIARQMFGCRGLTQSYAFSEVQPNHAVQVILRSKGEGQEDKLSVEDISKVLIEVRLQSWKKCWDTITAMFELGPHSPGTMLKDTMSADSWKNLSTLIGGGGEGHGSRKVFMLYLNIVQKSECNNSIDCK